VGLWELKKSANLCQSDFLNKSYFLNKAHPTKTFLKKNQQSFIIEKLLKLFVTMQLPPPKDAHSTAKTHKA